MLLLPAAIAEGIYGAMEGLNPVFIDYQGFSR